MQHPQVLGFFFMLQLILIFNVYEALACIRPPTTVVVNHSGRRGTSRTIQRAIDSVPSNNTRWVRIVIPAGVYREKLGIPADKPCIFLLGAGSNSTIIEWGDYGQMNTSATLTASASDFVAMGITFKNSYNLPPRPQDEITAEKRPALAAELVGDRSAFFHCTFQGVQDTLFDENGRHFFHKCIIQGETDFIFGNGQSVYQECVIQSVASPEGHIIGYITAQGRKSIQETSGYVFKGCTIMGNGQTYLGRAYRAFSRVIIANSVLTNVVYPIGWSAWHYRGHEGSLTYVEEGNTGPGADKSKRVRWLKHMGPAQLNQFLSTSYIDKEGWISKLPIR